MNTPTSNQTHEQPVATASRTDIGVGSTGGLGVWEIDRFGRWWRGRISLTRGLWRIGLTQDFGSCKIGLSFWERAGEMMLGFWSVDVARLMRFEPLTMEPHGLDMSDIIAELRKDPPSPNGRDEPRP